MSGGPGSFVGRGSLVGLGSRVGRSLLPGGGSVGGFTGGAEVAGMDVAGAEVRGTDVLGGKPSESRVGLTRKGEPPVAVEVGVTVVVTEIGVPNSSMATGRRGISAM